MWNYWTKERVVNGLRRFIRDYFENNEKNLPWNWHSYCVAVPQEKRREVQRARLYPPFQIVARFYESMPAAWAEFGYEVEEKPLEYWTRDEVISGLQRFYADFKCLPTYHQYLEKSQFSPRYKKDGTQSPDGAYGKYPCFLSIRKYFPTMREAWTAAGFAAGRSFEAWSANEDWFILESVGILPREEVAEFMGRSVPAIKRRIYDLGRINSKNRWGLTVNRAATLLGLGSAVVKKYLEYGMIPFFRGNKSIYINPADLLCVQEFDWSSGEINPELEKLVRRAQIQRIAKILKYRADWRKHEIYTVQKTRNYLAGRIKKPRVSAYFKELPAPPAEFNVGDWVVLKRRIRQVEVGRKGIIKGVYYSPQKYPRADGTRREAWMASVEFPKIKRLSKDSENRIHYNLPLDALLLSEKPELEPKPLTMTPDAVKARKRHKKYKYQAKEQLENIQNQLT